MFWAAFPICAASAPRAKGALLIAVVTEPVALGLIESPGTLGADIVVGEGQSLGVGLQFGGPYLGLFGCREKYVRQMPGRLCGETVDADGKRAFVLTLSTREQHIRREKATSNICTNSGLCALAFSIHLSLLGGEGLARMAQASHLRAVQAAQALAAVPGVALVNQSYVNEFTVTLPRPAAEVVDALAAKRVLGGWRCRAWSRRAGPGERTAGGHQRTDERGRHRGPGGGACGGIGMTVLNPAGWRPKWASAFPPRSKRPKP
jgi:glycine dehydrogenase subunit 1